VNLKPDHAKALNAMGRVQMKNGKIAEAKASLEAAKKADPELEEPTVLLSNIKDELTPEPRSYRKHKGSRHEKGSKSPKKGRKSAKSGKKGKGDSSASEEGAAKKSSKKGKKGKKKKNHQE
jgi:hypothetical protein